MEDTAACMARADANGRDKTFSTGDNFAPKGTSGNVWGQFVVTTGKELTTGTEDY